MDVQRQTKKPFFVYLPPKSPHGPYKADSSDMPNEDYKKFLGSHPQMNVQVAKIYWEVEYIDKRIGEMIQQLEEWGIADNTLFIFIGSDNGASGTAKVYNAGMNGQKGHPYQGGTRVPAFQMACRWYPRQFRKFSSDKSNGHHANSVGNYRYSYDGPA